MDDHKNQDNETIESIDQENQQDIARKGGMSQGQENNLGNFANDPGRVSETGQEEEDR